jgi:hypothetical protein
MLEVRARSLQSVEASSTPLKDFEGRVQNLSQGGICLLSSTPLQASTFVRCDISMPDLPVSVPTLLQVRWTSKRDPRTMNYLSGLRFVVLA